MVKKILFFFFIGILSVSADIRTDLQKAQTLFSNQQFQEALEITDSVLKENPYFRQALFLKGNILFELGETGEAETLWLKVYKIDASYMPVLFRLGEFYYNEKKIKESLAFYKKILTIEPLNIQAKLGTARDYLAAMELQQARSVLSEIQRLNPASPEVYYQFGILYLNQKKYKEAEKYFIRAKNLDAGFGKAYTQLGKIMLYKHDTEAAEYFLSEAVRLDKNNLQNYSSLAQLYITTKEWGKIKKLYENVKNRFSHNALFFFNFAVIEDFLNKPDLVINNLESSLKIDSQEPFAGLYYFFYLKDHEQYKKKSRNLAEKYFKKAFSFYNNGNYSKAVQYYRRGLMLYPESADARYYFSMCFKRLELTKRYLKELKISLSLDDSNEKRSFQYERDKRKFDFSLKKMKNIRPPHTPIKILIFPFQEESLNTFHLNAGKLLARELQIYLNNLPYAECTYYNGKTKNKYQKIHDYDFFIDGKFSEKNNYLSVSASLFSSYDRKELTAFQQSARDNNRINIALGNLTSNFDKVIPCKGEIFKIDDGKLYINLGKEEYMTKSSHLAVYSSLSPSFSVTEKKKIGDLKIISIYDDFLIAVPKNKKILNQIHLHQNVIIEQDKKKNDTRKQ